MEGQELAKEKKVEGLDILAWQGAIEVVSKVSIILIGICYVVGLFILNLHLRQYGIFHLNFLQIEYVMTGALWLFLCGMIYFFYYQFIIPRLPSAERIKEWKTWKGWTIGIIKFVGSVLFIILSAGFIVGQVSESGLLIHQLRTFAVLGVLSYNVISFINVSDWVRWVVRERASISQDKTEMRGRVYFVFYHTLLFLSALSSYAYYAYPTFSPVYGGGMKQKAQFVIKADQLDSVRHLGIDVNDESHSTSTVEVIFEASDFFVVSPPEGFNTMGKVKSIRVRKDLIDAAFYLDYK